MKKHLANTVSLFDLVKTLGFRPQKERGRDVFFPSPFQARRLPSFHIDRDENTWFDLDVQKGGDVVDFTLQFLRSRQLPDTVDDALAFLSGFNRTSLQPIRQARDPAPMPDSPLQVVSRFPAIIQPGLVRYLEQTRKIPRALANLYLRQVVVRHTRADKTAVMLGIRNEDGGMTLQNAFSQCVAGARDVTVLRGANPSSGDVHVFGDVFDFLSALADQGVSRFAGDAILLNHLPCLFLAMNYIEGYDRYRRLYLWLNNDRGGEKTSEVFRRVARREAHLDVFEMNRTYMPFRSVSDSRVHRLGSGADS